METVRHEQLRTVGLRVTRPRLSVLGVLEALVGSGIARRIEPPGGPALYELRVGDNHHHLVCRECGVVADVDCAVGAAPCPAPCDAGGFASTRRRSSSGGLCADRHLARSQHGTGTSSQIRRGVGA